MSKIGKFGQINYSMHIYNLNGKLFWNKIFNNQFKETANYGLWTFKMRLNAIKEI